MSKLADAVSATLGPKGRNVAINEPYGPPRIIHDGVSVAKRVDLFDEWEDMGAQLLKEAAIKTNDSAGDGTTTATILADSLVKSGISVIEAGKNPMTLKAEVEEAKEVALAELKKLSQEVKGNEDVEKVATISSADPEIGKIVAEAIKKTGDEGLVTTEMGKGYKTEVEYKSGLEFERGYATSSAYFVNNQDTAEAVIEDAYILMTDIKINHTHQIVPFMERFLKVSKNLVIIGEVQEEALATLVVNKIRGAGNFLAIQAPAFGERRLDELEDIASLVGGVVVREDSGRDIASIQIEELGRAEKVISNQDTTKIQGGMGDKARLKERVNNLRNQIKVANTEYDKEIKEQRLAKLIGGVAIIKVGAITEIEQADKKERVIDAVNAAKASVEEGIVAGGQIAFLTISQMDIWPDTTGAKLLREAIKKPFKILMDNAGYDYAECLGKITPIKYPMAIDQTDGKVKNMIDVGIIDPAKVCRSALENAVSVAGMAFTTQVLMSEPYKAIETK
jgi:chaperonin GroEL